MLYVNYRGLDFENMKSYIRMLPDDYAVHYHSLETQMRVLYQQDSEHVAIVQKPRHNVSLSKSNAQILRLDEVFPDTATDFQVFDRFKPVFAGLLDGQDQSIMLFQTYTSVVSQVKRRVADASPNQRVPYAVEFAYCAHQDSILNRLLDFVSRQQHKIVQLNVEFGIFEVEKGDGKQVALKNVIFNQPVHPNILRERILPEVVKNAVSSPSLLRLRISSTDTWEVRSQSATLSIAILPKICSDYSRKTVTASTEQLASETALFIGDSMGQSLSHCPLAQSGTSERLADRMKAQRCQCVERRGTQQLLVRNSGLCGCEKGQRRYSYELYTQAIQFANNSCFRAFRAALDHVRSSGVEFAPPRHAFLDQFKKCFQRCEPAFLLQFVGVSDCCEDTLSIALALSRARGLKLSPAQARDTVEIDREEYEFLRQAAVRAGTIAQDYASLREEYTNYKEMSTSQLNTLRERGNCLTERSRVLKEQLSNSRMRCQSEQRLVEELRREIQETDRLMAAYRPNNAYAPQAGQKLDNAQPQRYSIAEPQ